MSNTAYELWLIWQNPSSRQRYHVGNLVHTLSGYTFKYTKEGPRTLEDALKDGYVPHLSFPDLNKEYQSNSLFAAFSRRLPDTKRSDFKDILKILGLSSDYTVMDLLRATGGRLATDSYEFVVPVNLRSGHFVIDFYVAGWRYYEGDSVSQYLKVGDRIKLELEPSNKRDPNAILILSIGDKRLGYVPTYYSWFLSEAMNTHSGYDAIIEEYNPNLDYRERLKVQVTGTILRNPHTFLTQLVTA